jgi:hypothetical protein
MALTPLEPPENFTPLVYVLEGVELLGRSLGPLIGVFALYALLALALAPLLHAARFAALGASAVGMLGKYLVLALQSAALRIAILAVLMARHPASRWRLQYLHFFGVVTVLAIVVVLLLSGVELIRAFGVIGLWAAWLAASCVVFAPIYAMLGRANPVTAIVDSLRLVRRCFLQVSAFVGVAILAELMLERFVERSFADFLGSESGLMWTMGVVPLELIWAFVTAVYVAMFFRLATRA